MIGKQSNKTVKRKKNNGIESNRLEKLQYAMLDSLSEFDSSDNYIPYRDELEDK